MNRKNRLLFYIFSLLITSSMIFANIGGKAYLEIPANGTQLNSYGVKDTNEPGVAGVTVTVTNASGEKETTTTGDDGSWSVSLNAPARVEFSNWPSYLNSAPDGSSSATSVQFVNSDSSDVNFGLLNPNDYSNTAKPQYVTPVKIAGSNTESTEMALARNNYDDEGLNKRFYKGEGPEPTIDAEAKDIGATYGEAWDSKSKKLYISTVLTRHVGFGSGNPSRIWVADYVNLDANDRPTIGYFDLQGVNGIDLGSVTRSVGDGSDDNSLSPDSTKMNHDLDAYGKAGKISYGDIEYDIKSNTLWAINLNEKAVIKIDASGVDATAHTVDSNKVIQYKIGDLSGAPTCSGGELRPWGLSIHNGKGYIGTVCDASTSQSKDDLKAYIVSYDLNNPSNGLTIEYEYIKLGETRSTSGMYETDPSFFPWSDEYHDGTNGFEDVMGNKHNVEDDEYDGYNQPILADIVFDEKNHMYLSFMDRYGLQIGNYQHPAYSGSDNDKEIATGFGDMKKLCFNSGAWEMEAPGSATCPGGDENVYDTKRDPESNFFEDYAGDKMNHADSAGMALVKGNNQILRVVDDPHPTNDTGLDYIMTAGINTYSLKTGAIENWYGVYKAGYQDPTFNGAKTAGLGDLELLTAPAPIEVGNRVWSDEDGNGIQDVGEVGIDGVKVELICNGSKVAEATTDSGGYYIFSNDENSQSTINHIYNILELQPNIDSCKIVIPNVSTQTPLKDKSASPTNQGDNRQIDSDGVMNDDSDEVAILAKDIANPGANNHTYDFGFSSSKESVSIGSFVWEDLNRNGLQDDNENGIADVNVTLLDENGTVMPNPVQKTGADGQYYFSGLDEGTYSILVSPPLGKGYVPCTQQTTVDNNDTENDSNIATSNGNEYISGKFTLQVGTEPTESNGKKDTDSADDTNDENGNMTVDFCFYRPASIGDRVWYDENQNGIQDANERGVEGVTVELLTDCSRRGSTQTTTTDAEGRYKFTDLNAGDYCVEFSNLPDGYVVTSKDSGDDKSDSDASRTSPFQTDTTTLEAGEEDLSWDMGIYSPKVAIGDRVWYDTNKNGQQDDGEEGVPNIEIKLLKDCTTEVNSTTTDTNGNYIFEELSTGTYCLEFGTLPNGYVISPQDIGDDESDSDVNATTHKTVSVTLEDETRDLTWDMGIYKPTTSDNNSSDENSSTEDNNSDSNTSSEEVSSDDNKTDDNSSSNVDNSTDNQTDNGSSGTDTSNEGASSDDDKNNSSSSVVEHSRTTNQEDSNSEIDTSNERASSSDNIKNNNSSSNVDNSTDNQTDDNNSGTDTSNSEVLSEDSNSSDSNIYLITQDNNTSSINPSTDNQTEENSSNSQEDNKTLSILGDRVWYDENHNGIQDSNESGVKDVKVVLYESDCITAIKETRTDKNGKYLFRDLEANNYCIGFDELPLGYQFTPVYDNTGAGTELDCNVDPGTGKTSIINLPSATDDRRWDMGIVPKCRDEQDRALEVFDDSVTASTTDSVTTINVLENDHGNLDIESIRLVTSQEAEILYENGTAVGGTTLETTDRLVVEGEGVWTILSDGTIKFEAEDGFTGVPTPIYYIVKCKQGSVSNVGKVTITSNCVCDTYEESSIPVFTKISMLLLLLFSSILGAFLYRKELQELK